ncbi:uncharacterized protein Dere_GG17353 [Drosophila erecta]|nr:uncharacterized protein Dere_GG17353 [Drosophila erecta]
MAEEISSKFEFTNLQCTSTDKTFADFEFCYIRSANRSYKYITLKVNLFKTPVTKVKFNMILYKRFSGYRPFMFNITVDACRFLKNPDSNPVHDLFVDKIPTDFVNHRVTKILPFPEGDYQLETHWMAYEIDRAVVKIYYTIS